MGRRLERHLDEQKVAQLLATGKIKEPTTYPPPLEAAPSGKWPTPAYKAKLERRAARGAKVAVGRYVGLDHA